MTKKINYLLKQIVFIALFVHSGVIRAQQDVNPEGSISTNAENYQNVNIDLFRGRHNISIPIYNFKSKHLSIPITLDYTPVDILSEGNVYHPGWVGLGWNLTAGGVITRRVNGVPDETVGDVTHNLPAGNFSNGDINFNPYGKNSQNVSYSSLYESGEDEFSFNFCGYSGTFIYYRGKWQIYSDADLVITPMLVNNVLLGFILGTPDGITYTFGGASATEYSSSQTGYIYGQLISSAWFLTKIESPEGDQLNFTYDNTNPGYFIPITKQCKTYSSTTYIDGGGTTQQHDFGLIKTTPTDDEVAKLSVGYFVTPVYLASITSSTSPVILEFNKSISNEMNYANYPAAAANSRWYKLDNINLSTGDQIFKKFNLTYIENSNETLKLQTVQESGISTDGTSTSLPGYQFAYISNTDEVTPAVLSKITYPTGGYSSFLFEKNDYSVYFDISGGSTFWGIGDIGPAQAFQYKSDGFRIKEQTSKSSDADKAQITDYYYTDGFPNLDPALASQNASTGIKTRDILTQRTDLTYSWDTDGRAYSNYMTERTAYDCIYPNELPNKTVRDPELGYSSVWSVQSKEGESTAKSSLGYTNYRFINYITATQNSDGSTSYTQNNLNMAGKMTSCVKYNSQQMEINRTEYEYGNVGTETKMLRYYIKPVTFMDFNTRQLVTQYEAVAYNTNYYRYSLSSKTTTTPGFSTTTDYTYNPLTNNITEMCVTEPCINYSKIPIDADANDSDWTTTNTSYRYMDDFANLYNRNTDFHYVKNLPVEKVVRRNGKVISAEFTKYNATQNTILNQSYYIVRPSQVYELNISSPVTDYTPSTYDWNIADTRYKLKTTFDKYDNYGNLLEYHNEGCAHLSFYYDNVYQYPLIEIKNCTNTAFNAAFSGLDITKTSDMWRLRKLLPNAQITSYTYDPKFGVTSVISPNGVTTYEEYDVFGRLKDIKDNNQKLLKTMDYNYNIQ